MTGNVLYSVYSAMYSAMYSVQCQRPGGGQEVRVEMITSRSLFRVKHQEATISPLLSLIYSDSNISFIKHRRLKMTLVYYCG